MTTDKIFTTNLTCRVFESKGFIFFDVVSIYVLDFLAGVAVSVKLTSGFQIKSHHILRIQEKMVSCSF